MKLNLIFFTSMMLLSSCGVNIVDLSDVATGNTYQEPLKTLTNSGLEITEGDTSVNIPAGALYAEQSDGGISYFKITDLPDHGTLYNNGVAITLNDTFSSTDISNDYITFDHDFSIGNSSDSFAFSVLDSDQSTIIGSDIFTLTINSHAAAIAVTVQPIYSSNADWMDYVIYSDTAKDHYSQTETSCTGSETSALSCIHGGEKRSVAITGITSCDNLTGVDSLGAFDWECKLNSGTATFYSIGLKDGKGLKDLVNETSWKNIYFSAMKGSITIAQSSSTTWWSNTVAAMPDNSTIGDGGQVLTGSGTIYTVATTRGTDGNHIGSSRIAVVTLDNARLKWSGTTAANATWNGNIGSNVRCMLCVDGPDFLWIEGFFDAEPVTTSNRGMRMTTSTGMRFTQFRNVTINRFTNEAFTIDNSSRYNTFYNLRAISSASALRTEDGSVGNWFINVSVINSSQGMYLRSGGNYIINGHFINNSSYGLYISSDDNYISRVLTAGNGNHGVYFSSGSDRNTLSYITSINNGGNGFYLDTSDNNTILNSIAANNGGSGYYEANSLTNKYNKLVSTNNATYGFYSDTSTGSNIHGHFIVGNNGSGDCFETAGTNPPIVNTNCTSSGTDGSSTYSGGSTSTAILRTSGDLSDSFEGLVTTDSTNTSHTNGVETQSTILEDDWHTFDNRMRYWSEEGTSLIDTSSRGRCTSGNCQIADVRIKSSSTSTVLVNTANDGVNSNNTFVAGSSCPSEVAGSVNMTDLRSSTNTFLVNAYEIVRDRIGDDDGLCETDEACIYTPNHGLFQGETSSLSSSICTFADDASVSGVSIYSYSSLSSD